MTRTDLLAIALQRNLYYGWRSKEKRRDHILEIHIFISNFLHVFFLFPIIIKQTSMLFFKNISTLKLGLLIQK